MMILVIAPSLGAQKSYDLTGLEKPHQIVLDGDDLYIFEEADYSLHVYSISPFTSISKLGQKGDGPHDFKYLPYVYVQSEELAFTDFTKTVWFSKIGEVLRAKPYSDFADFDLNSEMLLFPAGENFLRITVFFATDVYPIMFQFNHFQMRLSIFFVSMIRSSLDIDFYKLLFP